VASCECGAVDGHTHLDRLAGTFARQRDQRVSRVGGPRLTTPCSPGLAEHPVGVRLPCRAEPRAGIRCQTGFDSVCAVRVGPLVRTAVDVQPPCPCPVVALGAGAHFPAPIAQALHTRRTSSRQKLRLGLRVRHRRRRDLRRLHVGELPGAERGVGLGQLLESPRCLQRPSCGANGLARRVRHPVRRTAMTAVAPHPGLLDPARQSGLDRAAQPLRSGRVVEELRGPRAVERDGIQLSRNPFELAEHLREHASPLGNGHRPGNHHVTNIRSPCQAPLLKPSTTRAQRSGSLLYGA
jgi:hypothetical protein